MQRVLWLFHLHEYLYNYATKTKGFIGTLTSQVVTINPWEVFELDSKLFRSFFLDIFPNNAIIVVYSHMRLLTYMEGTDGNIS